VDIAGQSLKVKGTSIDPHELRQATLYWDRVVWPTSNFMHFGGDQDAEYLEQVGFIERPQFNFASGEAAQVFAFTQLKAFRDLESRDPGCWALLQGPSSLMIKDGLAEEGRGLLVELYRAVPVPAEDVPLAEVLEFKERRRDELVAFRSELASFYSDISNSDDPAFEQRRHIETLDKACATMVRLAKESPIAFKLSDLKASISLPGAFKGALKGALAGATHQMPLVGAAIGGVAGAVNFSAGLGLRNARLSGSPFRYVYYTHKELF